MSPASPASPVGAGREPARQARGTLDTVGVLEPVAVTGCDICGALVGQREAARAAHRVDTVRLCNEELLSHPHAKAAPR